MMLQHRLWCPVCRRVTNITNDSPESTVRQQLNTCKCHGLLTYLESVQAPVDAVADEQQEPTADKPRLPPSREQWVDAGYAPHTYEPRFAGKEWLPTWSDPKYVPTRFRLTASGSVEPVNAPPKPTSSDTEQTAVAPPVEDWQRGQPPAEDDPGD